MPNVLVLVQLQEGLPARSALELLRAARELADRTAGRVQAAVLGALPAGLPATLCAHGADRVLGVAHPALAAYQPDLYVAALTQVVPQAEADVILLADDSSGREIAPRLGAGLV